MANHYFLISSLPHLLPDMAPPMTSEGFLEACETQLSASEFASLAGVSLVPRELASCSAEAGWNAAEIAIRNRLVKLRAQRLNRDANAFLQPYIDHFGWIDEALASAYDAGDPLQVERAVDRVRWRVLDDLEGDEVFSYGRLVLYRIKLLLLEKWAPLNRETGARELDLLIESKLKSLKLPELANG